MKLLFVRHGDPDYEHDSLTEKGWREAEYLAEKLSQTEAEFYYVSPLGRAKDTASLTLEKLHRTAEECQWLREFDALIWRPDVVDCKKICWDWLPQDWTRDSRFYQADQWFTQEAMQEGKVKEAYDWVTDNFDALLERHGYKRENRIYRAVRANSDTLVFFCHFGLECVLLSHLLHISPMVLWHGTCAAPSSITTVVTEERREGIASFRMLSFGDTSHLYCHGEPPAFSGRFRECWKNDSERMD